MALQGIAEKMSVSSEPSDNHSGMRVLANFRERFRNLGNRALAICAAIGLLVCLLEVLHLPPLHPELSDAESRLEDQYFLLRDYIWPNGFWKNANDDIVLVSVDNESARRLGLDDAQHWPRKVYAALIKKLREAGAEVVVLDVPLQGRSDYKPNVNPELDKGLAKLPISDGDTKFGAGAKESYDLDDQSLIAELKNSKNVVISSGVDMNVPNRSDAKGDLTVLLRSPFVGFVEAVGEDSGSIGNDAIIADDDGLVRHAPLLFDQLGPSFYKSLALRVAEKRVGARSIVDDRNMIFLKNHLMPTSIRINFCGPPGLFRVIPLWRALEWEKHAQHGLYSSGYRSNPKAAPDPNEWRSVDQVAIEAQNPFKGHIVLVGMFDPSWLKSTRQDVLYGNSERVFLTPVAAPSTPMTGVEVQANSIANTLSSSFIAEPEPWELLLLVLFVSLLVARILGWCASRSWISLVAIAVFSCLWIAMAFYSFVALRILIPVMVPLVGVAWPASIAVLLDQHYKIKRERQRQTKLFRSLAARPLANEIERRLLAELGLAGKRMTVTVVACQLREFSLDLDEQPEAVLQRLNECLGQIMQSIGEHGGLVERIWNCGVIGLWGAPIGMDPAAQARAAANCLADVCKRLGTLQQLGTTRSASPFGLTSSINTGEAICGTINASTHDSTLTQYGALGSCMDLAIALDALNSEYNTTCMIGATTANLLDQHFELRELDRKRLGPKDQNQSIYELLSVAGALPGIIEEAMALFRQGRTAFEDGRFRDAEQLFTTALGMVPDDKPSAIMLERCQNILSKSEKPASEGRRTPM